MARTRPRLYQVMDLVVAAITAALVTFLVSAVLDPQTSTTMGVLFAAMYYFSRNPWGSPNRGEWYNEQIDEFYFRFLPG